MHRFFMRWQGIEIQLESRAQSTAQLMTEVDVLGLVGHKPWQAVRTLNGEAKKCAWCALFKINHSRPCVPMLVCAEGLCRALIK